MEEKEGEVWECERRVAGGGRDGTDKSEANIHFFVHMSMFLRGTRGICLRFTGM